MISFVNTLHAKTIVIATQNEKKRAEIKDILKDVPGILLKGPDDFPFLPQVEEDGATFQENAIKKAIPLAKACNTWAMSDDSGLEIDALSGRPGICFVTRGPGATNASIGLHTAFQDSTPMILFVGQVASDQRDREAFQELDYRQVFGPGTLGMAKWVGEVQSADRLPEYVARAFHTALQGRPGPVVIALPEDMLTERVSISDALAAEPVETYPGLNEMARLQKLLWAA